MAKSLAELKSNRKNLVKAFQDNVGMAEGIKSLLIDLYPDSAHFILELLQNAEDMEATIARFYLASDQLCFEHNGTKRNFNLADIEAITNIGGNLQKRNDPTSIGKFGVGFKSVFSYTDTPIIHSGKYHFMIKDYFVPETDGIQPISTIDNQGISWTKFIFPFNNPSKPSKIAYEECLNSLYNLDDLSILFLRHIHRIEYQYSDNNICYIERIENDDCSVSVKYKSAHHKEESISDWYRFKTDCQITDDKGTVKQLPIAIAFASAKNAKTQKVQIVPVRDGKVCIYFPAIKEHSGLRFHINGPFASTVARESVRDCKENWDLIKMIGDLVATSLETLKTRKLINRELFEVLPNEQDQLSPFYSIIFQTIRYAFIDHAYLPTINQKYTSAKSGITGPSSISSLLTHDDLSTLFDIDKLWVMSVPQYTRADAFYKSLNIQRFTNEDFASLFHVRNRDKIEKLLSGKSDDWMKQFYYRCAKIDQNDHTDEEFEEYGSDIETTIQTGILESRVIRGTDGRLYKPSEICILPKNMTLQTRSTPIVKPDFIIPTSDKDFKAKKINKFFVNRLFISEYGPRAEIKQLLKRYHNNDWEVDKQYYNDLLSFAQYLSDAPSDYGLLQEIANLELFLFARGDNLYAECAHNLYLGLSYGNDLGELLSEFYRIPCLADVYKEHYNESQLKRFLKLANQCGINSQLSVQRRSATEHPLFYLKLKSFGTETIYKTDSDWAIPGLKGLLQKQSPIINKNLLETVKNCDAHYFTAQYSPNFKSSVKTCESTLIYYLKQYSWLLGKDGNLHKPSEIVIEELHKSFVIPPESALAKTLWIESFAARVSHEEQEKLRFEEELIQNARKIGKRLVDDEKYEKFLQWDAEQNRIRELSDPVQERSASELLKQQNRERTSSSLGNTAVESNSWKDISSTITNARADVQVIKLYGKIAESNKEERKQLLWWYHGACQMCGTSIKKYNQQPHFVARNIIYTRDLSIPLRQTTYLAWNSLSLCPNCAAKYRYCSKNLDNLYKQITTRRVANGAKEIVLEIEINGQVQKIHYTPEHFKILQKAVWAIDERIKTAK